MANNSNGRLWFTAGIDRSQLSRGVTAINKDFAGLRADANRTGSAFSDMWKTAAAGVGAYLSATAALDMGQQIINLTRQRELMEKSFEVLFGGADAAMQKIEEINQYAIFSPYAFDNVAKGAQTMVSFGVSAEEIMPTLRMLGDVAAGNAQRFESLSLVYGQIQSAGRLMGQDLLQLINAGFNPLQIISEQTGESMLDLKKKMESGLISFDMVADAFKTATSEGGKFYGMTDKMADSIEAAKSTFESAWVEKQIEWGNAAKDNIKTMYEFGSTVVENADDIAKVFAVLIAAVGSYKAALIAMSVTQSLVTGASSIKAFFSLAKGITSAKDAMLLLNIATKANPVGLIVSALAVATTAFFAFRKEVKSTEDILGDLDKAVQGFDAGTSKTEALTNRYEELRAKTELTKDEHEELKTVMAQLVETIPDAATAFDQYGNVLDINLGKVKEFNEAQKEAAKLVLQDTITQGEERLAELEKQVAREKELFSPGATKTMYQQQGQFGGVSTYQVKVSPEEQLEAAKNFQTLDAEAQKLRNSIESARESLAGLNADAETPSAQGVEPTPDPTPELTDDQKKALEKEAEARRKMYEQGLLDYETFQQGVERLAQEHATRVAAYEAEATSPEQLTQLTAGSEAQMAEEIEALNEKHQTERFLNLEAAREQVEITRDRIADEWKLEEEAFEKQQQLQKELIEANATYGQKRKAIIEKQQSEISAMYVGGTFDAQSGQMTGGILKAGVEQGNVDNLVGKYLISLQDLDVETAKGLGVLGDLWGNFANIAGTEIDKVIAKNEELYTLLESGAAFTPEIGKDFKITEEMFEGLKDVDNLADFRERLDKLKNISEESKTSFDGLGASWKQMIDGAKEGDLEAFQAGLNGVNNKIGAGIELANGLAGTFASIGDATGNDTWNDVAEGIGMVTSALSETLSMAQAGSAFGPVGAAIGAVIGLASSITGMFAAAAETRRETARLNEDLQQQEYLAQYEINQLYRERYDWAKKIGETEMQNAKRNIEEAKKQLEATSKEEDELLKKLQGEEYVTGYHTEETGLFGWGKGETVEDRASLAGLSYDEILDLEAQGKLTDEAQAYLDALRESKEEGEDLAETLEDAQEQLREAVVGMGFDEVVSHAMDDLLDGTKTAAEAFDEIMQGAMTNMLNEMMSQDVKDWYEGFAAAGADGYTETEKEYWKQRWEDMQAENEKRKEEVEDITGESFDTADQGQADASGITAIQEEAPGSIDGKLTALQITSSQTAVNTTFLVEGQSSLRASVAEMREGMDTLNYYAKYTLEEVKLIRGHTENLSAIAASVATVATNTKNL